MRDFIRVAKALSDPNRVKILKMLQHRDMYVCELREALGIAQPTVSKHLKVLETAGLVTFQKRGTWVSYRLANGMSSPYAANILGNLKHWLDDDFEIAALLGRLSTFCRDESCGRRKQ